MAVGDIYQMQQITMPYQFSVTVSYDTGEKHMRYHKYLCTNVSAQVLSQGHSNAMH